jgi:putative holliday junction resolvase
MLKRTKLAQPTAVMTVANHKVLALDVGERRIGLALASRIARLPAPLLTIDRKKDNALQVIKQVIAEHDVDALVIGLPRDMNGSETAQTKLVKDFSASLMALGINVYFQDESVTSIKAEEKLQAQSKTYTKADIDMYAATIILEDWLSNEI